MHGQMCKSLYRDETQGIQDFTSCEFIAYNIHCLLLFSKHLLFVVISPLRTDYLLITSETRKVIYIFRSS